MAVQAAPVKKAQAKAVVEYCHIDIETFSESNLKKVGGYNYSEHESTEIQCLFYRFGHNGPVHGWVPAESIPQEAYPRPEKMDKGGRFYVQPECPEDLSMWILSGGELRAWNAAFERTQLNGVAGRRIGFPPTPLEQWTCTMAKAAAHSLPQALEHAAKACGTYPKDTTGHHEMLQLCKPRNPSKTDPDERWYIDKYPIKYRSLYEYCADDVRAESDLDRYIPEMHPNEVKAYYLDQKINDRGMKIDLARVIDVQVLVDQYKAKLVEKCVEWTGFRPSQTEKLGNWVRAEGFPLENLQAATVKEAVKNPDCPGHVKRVLSLYSIHNMKAVAKYPAMERAACADDRLRGMFVYHAASTGRWSSRIVQLQNLFRPKLEPDDCDFAIDSFEFRDLDYIRGLWEINPMHIFASCVRGMLIPDIGKDLLCLDFSQIEARVIAWLAGQQDTLDVFASGEDIYKHAAAGIYKKAIEDVTKDERFIGKIAILALGYQGGKKAFAKMAKNYGVDIEESFAEEIKKDWRTANPKIVRLWYALEEYASAAIANPGKVFGMKDKRILFKVEGDFLYMRLPSGRRLAYYKPRLDGEGKPTFLGVDTYTRRWGRCKTYGGKLVENAVQAIARDLLLFALFNIERAGYPVIGTVHDEGIMEVDEGTVTWEDAAEIMCKQPNWSEGLPVAADGFVAKRYRK